MNINLHIERLVLDGFPLSSAQGMNVRREIERELSRLLAESSLPAQWHDGGAVREVPTQHFTPAAGERADGIGRDIAHSIYLGVGGQV